MFHKSWNSVIIVIKFIPNSGTKLKSVNEAHYTIFEKKRQKANKIIDMAALPPCKSVLHLYSKRVNAAAYTWQNAVVEFPL